MSALSFADAIEDGPIARAIAAARDVSVRDTPSLARVRALGTRGAIPLVPDPLILVSRLTAPGVVRSRIEYLRAMDRYPLMETVVVEVSAAQTRQLAMLGRKVQEAIARGHRIAVVAIPVDGESMTAELAQCVERTMTPVHCVDRLCLDDLVSIMATSVAVVPLSPALLAVACAFGRPSLWCPAAAWHRHASIDTALPGVEELIREDLDALLHTPANPSAADAWCTQLDAMFDRMAGHLSARNIGGPRLGTIAASRMTQLEAAQRVSGRRLADERLRFAERAEGLLAEIARLKSDIARRTALEAALREDMAGALAHARHEVSRGDMARQTARQLEAANTTLHATNAILEGENAARAATIVALERERDELLGAVDRFARSKSWRYLAPARAVAQTVRGWFGVRR